MNNQKQPGSIGVLVLWIIFFWPVAIYYGMTRDFSQNQSNTQNTQHSEKPVTVAPIATTPAPVAKKPAPATEKPAAKKPAAKKPAAKKPAAKKPAAKKPAAKK